jgi:hypothetical protein
MTIHEKKKQRFEFLKSIYEATNGNESIPVDGKLIGNELGIDHENSSNIIQYLIGEGLLKPSGAGLRMVITHSGIMEVEEALESPEKPTQHFLPINNYVSIGSMVNSSIQQGSPGAKQTFENKVKEASPDIKAFIVELKKAIDKLNLTIEVQNEMMAEIQTVETQSNSPKPKPTIIQESLKSIKTILEGVAVEAAAPLFIQKVNILLSMFSS